MMIPGKIIGLKPATLVVSEKVEHARLKNVRIIQRDALKTGLEPASIDVVLLFGVIPFPLLPLNRLLPEMHRILKPGGTLAVWLFPPLVHEWCLEKSFNPDCSPGWI